MISLKEYIDIQQHPEDYIYIEESKNQWGEKKGFWAKLKDWFKGLFSDGNDDNTPWSQDVEKNINGNGKAALKFRDYLKDDYSVKQLKFVTLELNKEINSCLMPNNIQPDSQNKIGFYKFLDVLNEKDYNRKYDFIGLLYKDQIGKASYIDTVGIFAIKFDDMNPTKLILRQFQLDYKYFDKIKYKEFINKFFKYLRESNKYQKVSHIKYFKKYNEENFNILINDCSFVKNAEGKNNDKIIAIRRL